MPRINSAQSKLTEELEAGTFDIVAANILAGPLIELAPRLAAHLRPGGAIVLAGLLSAQADEVTRAYAPYCTDFAQTADQAWVRLAAIRR